MKDRFGREITYLRMSVTELCNLRCRYCMPAEGICKRSHDEMLSQEEILLALRVAAELGVRKLRVTGGEPLVKPNILDICAEAAQIPGIEEICMTTNGLLLPGLAKPLKRAGVSRLNISLDTLDERKYAWMTRTGELDMAMKGIEAALDAGFERTKLNAVLIGGWNDDEIRPLAELTLRWPVDVRFIELMPMADKAAFGPEARAPEESLWEALDALEDEDVILVEGFKHAPIPRVGLCRMAAGKPLPEPPETYIAVVSDVHIATAVPRFDWNAHQQLMDFLLEQRD